MNNKLPKYSVKEEIFNIISHSIGTILSIVGLILMAKFAAQTGSALKIAAFLIYGIALTICYISSTLYHASNENKREIFNKIDHSAIYLLIAGTYTPYTLISLNGGWGWTIFSIIWACALGGIIFKLFFYTQKLRKLSAILYLVMGWLMVIAIKPLINNLSTAALLWLGIGGFFYSFGVIFYLSKRIPFSHGIWHLFVLAGSAAHFVSLFFYVL